MLRRTLSRFAKLLGKTACPPVRSNVRTCARRAFRPALETLEAREVPAAPVFATASDRFIAPGTPFYAQVFATDADREWVTYSATNLPQGLTIDQNTGTVSGVVPLNTYQAAQVFTVTFSANAGNDTTTLDVDYTIANGVYQWS